MKTQRKLLVLTRHGVKQKGNGRGNLLKFISIQKLHSVGKSLGKYFSQEEINPSNTLIRHSDQLRTLRTAKSILNGLSNGEAHSLTNRQLDTLQKLSYDVKQDDRLSYGTDFKFNEDAFIAQGERDYMDRWIDNQNSAIYEGVKVTPFSQILRDSKKCLADNFTYLVSEKHGKRLGILATHGGIIEGLVVAAVNSGRNNPISKLEDIGGHFPMEGNALVEIDYKPKSGIYTARLIRGDQTYDVNLD